MANKTLDWAERRRLELDHDRGSQPRSPLIAADSSAEVADGRNRDPSGALRLGQSPLRLRDAILRLEPRMRESQRQQPPRIDRWGARGQDRPFEAVADVTTGEVLREGGEVIAGSR